MLKKYKKKLDINRIELTDNSFLYCNAKNPDCQSSTHLIRVFSKKNSNKSRNLYLSDLSFLQHNNTFYGRYGFLPINKLNYKKFAKNIDIINNTKTKDIILNKIITKDIKKLVNAELLKIIMKYHEKYSEKNMTIWFNKISKILLKTNCEIFDYFIDKIFDYLHLAHFHRMGFFLEI